MQESSEIERKKGPVLRIQNNTSRLFSIKLLHIQRSHPLSSAHTIQRWRALGPTTDAAVLAQNNRATVRELSSFRNVESGSPVERDESWSPAYARALRADSVR